MHLGWHFCAMRDGKPILRDGTPLEIGRTYEHHGPLVMCGAGYHSSGRVIDALRYAPGDYLCRVLASHDVADTDKHVSRYRVALVGYVATATLHLFSARIAYCALLAEREAGREPHPDSWRAVATKVSWCRGEATDDDLYAALSAAWSADYAANSASYAARSAAGAANAANAARSAAYAASNAAYAASSTASSAADALLLSMLPKKLVDPSLIETALAEVED